MEAYSQTAWRPVKSLVRAHLRKAVNKPHDMGESASGTLTDAEEASEDFQAPSGQDSAVIEVASEAYSRDSSSPAPHE